MSLKALLRLWPLGLAIACLAAGFYGRGIYDDSRRLDHVERAQLEAERTNTAEAEQQRAASEVSHEISLSIARGPAGDRISPYLECMLRAVDQRRPVADCVHDRLHSPQMSLETLTDRAGRGPAGRVQDPD